MKNNKKYHNLYLIIFSIIIIIFLIIYIKYNKTNLLKYLSIQEHFNTDNTMNLSEDEEQHPKICYITAIYGNYETSCKKYVKQTILSDFICFTDNKNITSNGWIIDNTPYHIINKCKFDNGTYVNSIGKNNHTFNIAKYYKQSFQNIPRLKDYDVIIWLDGTIEIIYDKVSEYILDNIYKYKIIGWHHELRYGNLKEEVNASNIDRYTLNFWNNQSQPIQEINKQYDTYINDGYDENYFKKINSHTPHLGVWITCFVAFLNKDSTVSNFLNMWYLQTLKFSTQDQVSFSYTCQKTNLIPFTLPNDEIPGTPHSSTLFYIKEQHGK
jgi:hypothetical protein